MNSKIRRCRIICSKVTYAFVVGNPVTVCNFCRQVQGKFPNHYFRNDLNIGSFVVWQVAAI